MSFRTEQEAFWAGNFGDADNERNDGPQLVAANTALFADVFRRAPGVTSVCELGANIGLNVRAIQHLLPSAQITGVEINGAAVAKLADTGCEVVHASVLDVELPDGGFDLVFTKTVLIHINPDELLKVYDLMAAASSRYVLMVEYYNPTPVTVPYRGNTEHLFKRDFAGDFLDRHGHFDLVDYGFCYHRGRFAQDDMTWFLMERRG